MDVVLFTADARTAEAQALSSELDRLGLDASVRDWRAEPPAQDEAAGVALGPASDRDAGAMLSALRRAERRVALLNPVASLEPCLLGSAEASLRDLGFPVASARDECDGGPSQSIFLIGRSCSHAVRKEGDETARVRPRTVDLLLASHARDALPHRPRYLRVDLVFGVAGDPRIAGLDALVRDVRLDLFPAAARRLAVEVERLVRAGVFVRRLERLHEHPR